MPKKETIKPKRKYEKLPTETQIVKVLDEYFNECKEEKSTPTKNGICIVLNISRKTYNVWKKKSNTLKRAESIIEEYWVQALRANNVAGVIFYLKNAFGYRDRKDLDLTSGGKQLNFNDDQRNKIARRITAGGESTPAPTGKKTPN